MTEKIEIVIFVKKIMFNSSEVYYFNSNKDIYNFTNRKQCCLECFNEKNKNNERNKYVNLNENTK
ncbi:MAG: hypothetical protein OHM56_01455 [Spiroplasma phoeniceum]|nr:MAG: hypothetical protein OHM57_00730 [Spiroplasma phoeniceum]UZQ30236.1 MAG: hypothetical protein OHM57_00880 [Spiroplasma phoeniceum]UZQ32629.1 MAG: hypothetical protein OHM56_01305 [Spiroplasma phoeniceum]UZQ32657.1 MAG: hypothetical protein OHM56_01455 [Spiroplasma phoeniceum]